MFRYFYPVESPPDPIENSDNLFHLLRGINELNFRMEEGHFYYDMQHNSHSIVLVMSTLCYDKTVLKPVIGFFLDRLRDLIPFVPELHKLAQGSCDWSAFERFISNNHGCFTEVIAERVRILLEQMEL